MPIDMRSFTSRGRLLATAISRATSRSRSALARSVLPSLMLAGASALSGCTMLLDTDKAQCERQSDCIELFGASAPYVCVARVCERPFCDVDADCRARGGSFASSVCDAVQHHCVEAECMLEQDCASGTTCDVNTNRCVPRECTITADCLTPDRESPTVECVAGFCVDEKWSCIGEPDPRPRVAGEKGALEIPLLNALTQTPLPGAIWKARVCLPPEEDLNCERRITTDPPPSYDPESGIMVIAGLDPDLPVRILLDESSNSDVIPMEFITQKSPVGVTRVPSLGFATLSGLATLISGYKLPGSSGVTFASVFRPGMGTGYGTVFDCNDKPTAGVQIKFHTPDGAPVPNFNPYFFDDQLVAYPGASLPPPYDGPIRSYTFGVGIFSALNLPPNQLLKVHTKLMVDDRTERTRVIREGLSVSLQPSRRTTMHLYPRNYALRRAP